MKVPHKVSAAQSGFVLLETIQCSPFVLGVALKTLLCFPEMSVIC